MNLSELIYKRFSSYTQLTKFLASFCGHPAVFNPDSPGDNQEGWENKTQYPRIVYNYDMQANEERNSAGTLNISLLCQNTEDVLPEVIEPEVRNCLKDIVLTAENGITYCFAWARTDSFAVEDKTENPFITIGCEVRFDIVEYRSMETTDPDPIMAANKYIKEILPESLIIGYEKMEEITEASAKKPVIYNRLVSAEKREETNNVVWMDGKIAIHILCPEVNTRTKVIAMILNKLSLDGEIQMLDHSPMFVKQAQANYKSDYLKSGQIFFTGRYGLLRYKPKSHALKGQHLEF